MMTAAHIGVVMDIPDGHGTGPCSHEGERGSLFVGIGVIWGFVEDNMDGEVERPEDWLGSSIEVKNQPRMAVDVCGSGAKIPGWGAW